MAKKEPKMVILVRNDLKMRKGKLAAQVGHASQAFLIENCESDRDDELLVKLSWNEATWLNGSRIKIVLKVDDLDELNEITVRSQANGLQTHIIIDEGRTEFNGVKTITCAAIGPDDPDEIDKITGHLTPL